MSLNNKGITLFILCAILNLTTCSYLSTRPNPEERELLQQSLKNLSSEFSTPRLVTGELMVSVSDVQELESDQLEAVNLSRNLPQNTASALLIWSAAIGDYPTQKRLSAGSVDPQPDQIFQDSQYGNQILHWNVKQQLSGNTKFATTRKFRYITYDYRPVVKRSEERNQWDQIPSHILDKYTREERFLEHVPALVDTVFVLLENVSDPVTQAEVLYDWVQASMTYVYPPEQRGVENALLTLQGDCGQYSALFITMARIAGIPARQQSGFNFVPGNTGSHVWSEIYLPVKGWVPVDATRKDGFLHLDNGRLITSIGLNIPLENAPEWATFSNSEVELGRTDFMQMYTLASNGFEANYSSSRRVIRSVQLD